MHAQRRLEYLLSVCQSPPYITSHATIRSKTATVYLRHNKGINDRSVFSENVSLPRYRITALEQLLIDHFSRAVHAHHFDDMVNVTPFVS